MAAARASLVQLPRGHCRSGQPLSSLNLFFVTFSVGLDSSTLAVLLFALHSPRPSPALTVLSRRVMALAAGGRDGASRRSDRRSGWRSGPRAVTSP